MNKTTAILLIVIATLSIFLGSTIQSKAQNKSFAGVIPFTTSSDRLGFLEQSTGKIYMYDSNYSQCVFIGQLQGLGQPIQMIRKSQ